MNAPTPTAEPTAERLFPAYSITWNQQRTYPSPPPDWHLEVGGLVRAPQRLTLNIQSVR